MHSFRFLCIAGTFDRYHDWCHNPNSLFMRKMAELGGEPIRRKDGSLYSWSGKLQGTFWTGEEEWDKESEVVEELLAPYDLADRIVWAHSHGGQIAIKLAARGFQLRTFTTIATPFRPNLNPEEASKHIGFWQHVYDPEKDWIGTAKRAARFALGGLGGGGVIGERRFLVGDVLNVAIPGCRHSDVFTTYFDQMVAAGVFHRSYQLGL